MEKISNIIGTVTTKNVKAVCKAIIDHYGVQVYYGPESKLMPVVAEALDLLKVQNKKAFLANVSMTVRDQVFLCYRIGDKVMPPWLQVAILAHECVHAVQWREHPFFLVQYFAKSNQRAMFEAEAMAVQMEVEWRLTGKITAPEQYADKLAWYRCSKKDIAVTKKLLVVTQDILMKGGGVAPVMAVIQRAIGK